MTTSLAELPDADRSQVARIFIETQLEAHRRELLSFCYRMLGSSADAQDAVQDTMLRAWRSLDTFEGRSSMRAWLHRIATNVCLDLLRDRKRRARPIDIILPQAPLAENLRSRPENTWLEPVPDTWLPTPVEDPAEAAAARDSVRMAFIVALQVLVPRQRAILILSDVLKFRAAEVAQILEVTVPSVTGGLQRARAAIGTRRVAPAPGELDETDRELLDAYVRAFEAYDVNQLVRLLHQDATQSMPPYDLWLRGRDDVLAWWFGPGVACADSVLVPVGTANGLPAFGQYKPHPGGGRRPWALQVVELRDRFVAGVTSYLSVDRLFPLFGLPDRLD